MTEHRRWPAYPVGLRLSPYGDNAVRERRLVRLTLLVAGMAWFGYAMLHGRRNPGPGLHGADLLYTAGVVVAVGAFLAGVVARRFERPYGHLLYVLSAAATVTLYLMAPDRPAGALLFVLAGFAAGGYPIRRSAS